MKRIAFIHILVLGLGTLAFAQLQANPKPRISVAPRIAVAPMAWGEMSGSYLGVDIEEITPERVSALKLKEERGVEVTMVDQDAPAAKAGLKEHDVITEFNGQRVEGREQFTRFIRETPPGRTVTLGIIRNAQPMQLKATLGDRKDAMAKVYKYRRMEAPRVPEAPMVPDIDIDIPAMDIVVPSTTSGLLLENLTPQLAQYFGVKSGEGVLVRSVEKGSPAERAGIKAGDVIVKVGEETVESRSDYRQAIRHRSSDTLKIVVIRDKREQTLTMTLPATEKDSSKRLLPPDFDFQFDSDFDEDFDFDVDTSAFNHLTNAFEMVTPEIETQLDGVSAVIASRTRDALRRIPLEVPTEPCDLR